VLLNPCPNTDAHRFPRNCSLRRLKNKASRNVTTTRWHLARYGRTRRDRGDPREQHADHLGAQDIGDPRLEVAAVDDFLTKNGNRPGEQQQRPRARLPCRSLNWLRSCFCPVRWLRTGMIRPSCTITLALPRCGSGRRWSRTLGTKVTSSAGTPSLGSAAIPPCGDGLAAGAAGRRWPARPGSRCEHRVQHDHGGDRDAQPRWLGRAIA
jgi:hypothetical protein